MCFMPQDASQNVLVLIDGNAILHRAYHAMPPLTNPEGKQVNAIYGFFGILLNILHDQNPTYLTICFDRSKPTIRQSMYAGYHAHRPPMDAELAGQIGGIDELLQRLRAKTYALDGYEGDDLIGTLSKKAVEEIKGVEVVIVTGDRDMFQLVTKQVKVLMPVSGITKSALFDEAAVEAKYGVHPSQFIDYKALIGDASDGYPGVTGIGPKTASGLLKQYKTFDNLYNSIPDLPEKVGVKLATDAEQAALAKKLATIITDAPISFDEKECLVNKLDMAALKEGFEKNGFRSLIARMDSRYPEVPKKEKKKDVPDGQMGLL